ncbi:cupin domain-containing protein [Nocardia vinacea]|uniref:Cupin domain-containing protein n=1 Tax=Nocardia vinacea TaxID=96468 RepID=A0ABZ1YVC1_9NOCA|nr:cupin domain-containing protein [Nocardia vinacea]
MLIVTEDAGLVQRRGGPVETVRTGDTVHIAPGEWHWHGATSTTAMTHLAIEELSDDGTEPEAGAPVTDAEYAAAEAVDAPPIIRSTNHCPRCTPWVEVRRITIAPNHAAGLHVHNGPVFGSVESGSVIYQIDGRPESVLGPGDVFYEPEGVRIARFDAEGEGVTFLGSMPTRLPRSNSLRTSRIEYRPRARRCW